MADRIVIRASAPLSGSVAVPGAKNSVLKLMAATLLADGEYHFTNVPDIADVGMMAELLGAIGVRTVARGPHEIRLERSGPVTPVAPPELVERIRASINVLGPLLGRFGEVSLAMPGGDNFGSRPIDMHIKGLESMGAEFTTTDRLVRARVRSRGRLHGAKIRLEFPSVGATENLLMAAVYAHGLTVIDNAAREPEIQDLCDMLVKMGAGVSGSGSPTIVVEGVEPGSLRAVSHDVVPDRVQAATYVAAVGVCGGEIVAAGARADHMEHVIDRYREMGIEVVPVAEGLRVAAEGRLHSVDLATLPYPGVATDYKPLLVTMLSVADGVSFVTENLYAERFLYVGELVRLGADIRTDGHQAVVRGVPKLIGTDVCAHDIRAGAAVVVAGLVAEGETTVTGVHHIDRGYEDLVGRLASLGADISRVSDT